MNFYQLPVEKVLDYFSTSFSGFSQKEAKERLRRYGKNILPEKDKESLFLIFLKQFKNIFNFVLFLVLIFDLFLGKITDALIVFFVILVNAFLGFFFEYRKDKTLEKLKEISKPKSKVIREGEIKEIDSENIVPGDIVLIEEGDIVPADLRIFEVDNLKIDESILTGESLPVEKTKEVLKEDLPISERKSMAFKGSFVIEGKGKGIVVATGLNAYIGSIYEKYQETKRYAPHFEKLSRDLVKKMLLIALGTNIIILYLAFKGQFSFSESLLFSASSFVSSIPEGLPVIVTVLLALSAYLLFKNNNVLAKNLGALENLSVINLLLTDKTGTLTQNLMTVKKIYVDFEEIEITGDGYDLEGEFLVNNKKINILGNYPLIKLLNISAVLNEAEIIKGEEIKFKGNPREIALLILLEKAGIKKEKILETEKIIKKEPFSRITKHKRVIVQNPETESYYLGAFEKLIEKSQFLLTKNGIKKFEDYQKNQFLNQGLIYAQNGFSVLGCSFSKGEKEENLIFVGLIALYDPPKKEVKETLEKLNLAGVDVRILTGDHKETAIYIAKEIGFKNLTTLEEKEIEKLSDKELLEKIKETYIFARVTPETKYRILELYQKLGYSCAYIGDGVNDILSLKKAEVGVAMGKRGSEVAKEASDIVLLDDDFKNLEPSFLEGRKIFYNLKKVVFFLITTNVAESITIISSLFLGFPFILKPTHILLLNFITDTLIGTSLAFEKEDKKELAQKPVKAKESLISFSIFPFLILMATSMTILTVSIFWKEYQTNLDKARTLAFLLMSFTQIFNALNLRSFEKSVFKISFRNNYYLVFSLTISMLLQILFVFSSSLRQIFGFSLISFSEFILVILLSSLVLIIGETYKLVKRSLK